MESRKTKFVKFTCICQLEPFEPKLLKNHLLISKLHKIRPIFSLRTKGRTYKNNVEHLKAISLIKLMLFNKISILLTHKNSQNIFIFRKFQNLIPKLSVSHLSQILFDASQSQNQSKIKTSKQKIQTCINKCSVIELSSFKYLKRSIKTNFRFFLKSHLSTINISLLSYDEKILITGGVDGALRIWDAESFTIKKSLFFHYSNIVALDIRPDSNFALSGSLDKTTALWDLNKLKLKSCFASPQRVNSVKFLNKSIIIISSLDYLINFWNVDTKRLIYQINTFCTTFLMDYSKKFKSIIVINQKGTIDKINIITQVKVFNSNLNSMPRCCALAEKENLIIVGETSGCITALSMSSMEIVKSVNGHKDLICCITICLKGEFLASASIDAYIKIWNIKKFSAFKIFFMNGYGIINFTFREKFIYACLSNSILKKIIFLDNSGQIEETKRGNFNNSCLAVSIKLKLIAYANLNLELYSLETNLNFKTHKFSDFILSLSFAGSIIACGFDSGKIAILNIPELIEFQRFSLVYTRINYFVFSSRLDKLLYSTINRSHIVDFKNKEVVFSHHIEIISGAFHKGTDSAILIDEQSTLWILRKNLYLRKIIHLCESKQIYFPIWGDIIILKNTSNLCFSIDIKKGILMNWNDKMRNLLQSLLYSKKTVIISSLNYCDFIR